MEEFVLQTKGDLYMKFRLYIWDLTNTADDWIKENLNPERINIVGHIFDTNELILLKKYPESYDYVFIFEEYCKDLNLDILHKLSVPDKKIIFCNEIQSLWEHQQDLYYVLKENSLAFLQINNYQNTLRKDFVCASADNLSYIGYASDKAILPYMDIHKHNWAYEEMQTFYQLSKKYFPHRNNAKYFFDIGANIGTSCIYFKKILDPSISIVAFEPIHITCNLLHANMYLNDVPESDYVIEHLGLSDTNTAQEIFFNPSNPGGSSFMMQCDKTTEISRLTTFDSYLDTHRIHPDEIKYIWIDTEGYETNVLKGAMQALTQNDIPIFMEFTPVFLNEKNEFHDFMRIITSLYKKYIIIQETITSGHDVLHDIDELWEYEKINLELQYDLFFIK